MTNAMKFSFQNLQPLDQNLAVRAEKLLRKRTLTEQQILDLQSAAHASGFMAGKSAMHAQIEQESSECLQEITAQYEAVCGQVNQHMTLIRAQAAELALAIASKLTPALIAREPYAEIEALFKACVSGLTAEPRIVIRAREELVQELKTRIEDAAHQAGYSGRIVIIGAADSQSPLCLIEWADGGVAHHSPGHLNEISEIIAHYVENTGSCPESPLQKVTNDE